MAVNASDDNVNQFLQLRHSFAVLNESLHADYIERYAEKLKNDPKCFWNFVNQKRQTKGYPKNMHLDDLTASTTEETADLFADYFASVYAPDDGRQLECNVDRKCSLNDVDLTLNDVLLGLSSLDMHKSPGPDGIPPRLLKDFAAELAEPVKKTIRLIPD